MAHSAAKLHILGVIHEREFPERNKFAGAQQGVLKEKPDECSGAPERGVVEQYSA